MSGAALAKIIRNERPGLPIVLLSACDTELLGRFLPTLVDAVVAKGIDPPQALLEAIERLTGTRPEPSPAKVSQVVEDARKLREESKATRSETRSLLERLQKAE